MSASPEHTPSGRPVVLPVDTPSRTALACATMIAAFLAAIITGATAMAFGEYATVHRIIAGACAAVSLPLLATVVLAARSSRGRSTLTLDESGLSWTHRGRTVRLDWSEFTEADVRDPSGPKRSRSGQPHLDLLPADPARFTEHETLREKLATTEDDTPARLRLRFALQDDRAGASSTEALRRFAPALLDQDQES